MKKSFFKVRLRQKNQITLPSEIQKLLDLQEGEELAFSVDENGRVVVTRLQVISPDQAWFWADRWQENEREVQREIESGQGKKFDDVEDMISWLDEDENA